MKNSFFGTLCEYRRNMMHRWNSREKSRTETKTSNVDVWVTVCELEIVPLDGVRATLKCISHGDDILVSGKHGLLYRQIYYLHQIIHLCIVHAFIRCYDNDIIYYRMAYRSSARKRHHTFDSRLSESCVSANTLCVITRTHCQCKMEWSLCHAWWQENKDGE